MYWQSEKNLLSSNSSSTCPHNMVNFGPLVAEIFSLVWGTPANFNQFRVLAVLLHGTLVVSVSQTLRRWTEGATYIRQVGHHVRHGPHSSFYWASTLPTYTSNQVLTWTRPSNPLLTTMDAPIATRNSSGDMRVGNYSLNSRLLPPLILPKYSLNNHSDCINMVIDYQK